MSESKFLQFSEIYPLPSHVDIKGKGGYRCVETIVDRNSIPYSKRSVGMLVYVIEDDVIYKLKTNPRVNITESLDWRDIRDVEVVAINTNDLILYEGNSYKSTNLSNPTIDLNTDSSYGKIIWCLEVKDVPPSLTFKDKILWRFKDDLELSLGSFNVFEFETWDGGKTWLGISNKYSLSTPASNVSGGGVADALTWDVVT